MSRSLSARAARPMFPNAAGIDIGSTHHFVAVPPGRAANGKDVREFEAFTAGLHQVADWLKECKIDTVVMESTGVYWIPLFELLEERGFDVRLVDARHTRNVPGRKTDALDCQWLQELHSFGLLSAAFRPDERACVFRSFLRQRAMLVRYASQHIQHMQKALTQMNLKLQHVVSDITGETGMRIIRAILKGERNPRTLAEMRDRRCKNPVEVIAKSLEGNYREEHLFELEQAVSLYDAYHQKMGECDAKIEACLKSFEDQSGGEKPPCRRQIGNAPGFDLTGALFRMCGVDLTEIDGINAQTASKVIGETGIDMSFWPSAGHFASWLGLCPGNQKSGGKQLSGRTKPCSNKAKDALRVAAQTLTRSKSALGEFFRKMRAKLGPPKAITAAAHKMARIIYTMLKTKKPYSDIGPEKYNEQFKQRQIRKLKRKASEYGYELKPLEAAS
jgi:transposase